MNSSSRRMQWFKHPIFSTLTLRELQVVGASAEGWSNKRIAELFDISSTSVAQAMGRAYTKLHMTPNCNVVNRVRIAHMVIRAELQGIGADLTWDNKL